jgi:hypothetical protein
MAKPHSMVIRFAFQQMVYFPFLLLGPFTSAKRHTLLSFSKLLPPSKRRQKPLEGNFFPMNLSLISSAEEEKRTRRGENISNAEGKHAQVSFSYKSRYMNW